MKYLTKQDNIFPTDAIHRENDILKIKDAYNLKLLSFVHDCINKNSIPLFHNYFKTQTHSYQIRYTDKLKPPKIKTNMGASAIKCTAAKIWNSNDIARKYRSFSKSTMKKHIFNSYTATYLNTYLPQ